MKTKIFVLAMLSVLVLSSCTSKEEDKIEDYLTPNSYNAFSYYMDGEYEEAIFIFDIVLQNPDSTDDISSIWKMKGTSYFMLDSIDKAIKCFDKSIEIDSNNYLTFHEKGNIYKSLGRYEEAIKYYDKCIELNSSSDLTWYEKAVTYSLLKNKREMIISLLNAILIDETYLNEEYSYYLKKNTAFKEYWDDPDFIELTKEVSDDN